MWEKVQAALPSIVFSVTVSAITLAGTVAVLNTKVDATSTQIKDFVPREEYNQMYDLIKQNKNYEDSRFNEIEHQLNQIYVIEIQKR